MAQYFSLHPQNPQPRLIQMAVRISREGGLVVYPTDSTYAIGCHIGDKSAMERMRAIRQVDARHHFSLVCRDLSEIALYAKVDNQQFRLLKANTPGCYVFILEATREVPKRLQHPSRRTIGLRVPDHPVVRALLAQLDEPLLSTTLSLPDEEEPLTDPQVFRHKIENQVELILDAGPCGMEPTTVLNLTGPEPVVVRQGKAVNALFGL